SAVMPVSREWLPYESVEDSASVTKAVSDRRRFVKGSRYNLVSGTPIASSTSTDTGSEATAIHLARALPDPAYDDAVAVSMKTIGVTHRAWRSGDPLPASAPHGSHPATPMSPSHPGRVH
ncbi:hypothetical protein OY671_010556, partial [Metschnikowia pulcherrima]